MDKWNPAKEADNIAKHGFPFEGFEAIWDGPTYSEFGGYERNGEERYNVIGWIDGILMHRTHTERHGMPRPISLRKADKHEARQYFKAHPHL